MTINYSQKKDEVLKLWQDTFTLCQQMVKKAKSGKADLSASLLKEVNSFLKTSLQMLEENIAVEEEQKRMEAAQIDEADLPTFDDLPEVDEAPMSTKMKTDAFEF